MTFVNEFVPTEDVKKYNIREMWNGYRIPVAANTDPDFRFPWTMDRERDMFFIVANIGKEEFGNQLECIFWWQGAQLNVVIEVVSGDADFKKDVGFITWGLLKIEKPEGCQLTDEEIIPVLKEALVVYGYWGPYQQLSDYTVDFTF